MAPNASCLVAPLCVKGMCFSLCSTEPHGAMNDTLIDGSSCSDTEPHGAMNDTLIDGSSCTATEIESDGDVCPDTLIEGDDDTCPDTMIELDDDGAGQMKDEQLESNDDEDKPSEGNDAGHVNSSPITIKDDDNSDNEEETHHTVIRVPAHLDGTLPDDLVELYSPPRLQPLAVARGLRCSLSADLLSSWDFESLEARKNFLRELESRRPRVLMTCAPCTFYCRLMALWNLKKMTEDEKARRRIEADTLFDFGMYCYKYNVEAGRKAVHEHPESATSWKKSNVSEMKARHDAYLSKFDQCLYGLASPITNLPLRKRTMLLSNLGEIHACFHGNLCDGEHMHKANEGSEGGHKLSVWAQVYPAKMCHALVECFVAFLSTQLV